jgi:hypothetical protein
VYGIHERVTERDKGIAAVCILLSARRLSRDRRRLDPGLDQGDEPVVSGPIWVIRLTDRIGQTIQPFDTRADAVWVERSARIYEVEAVGGGYAGDLLREQVGDGVEVALLAGADARAEVALLAVEQPRIADDDDLRIRRAVPDVGVERVELPGSVLVMKLFALLISLVHVNGNGSAHRLITSTNPASLPPIEMVTRLLEADSALSWLARTSGIRAPEQATCERCSPSRLAIVTA